MDAYDIPHDKITFEEWLDLDGEARSELIDGELVMMAEPVIAHQIVSMELARQISTFLLGKPCKVFHTGTAVKLFDDRDTAVVPDLLVVCDKSKITEKFIKGAPDLVIEILSPSTEKYDRTTKLKYYMQAGVKEYWTVDVRIQVIQVLLFSSGDCVMKTYSFPDDKSMPVATLPGLEIDLGYVFEA